MVDDRERDAVGDLRCGRDRGTDLRRADARVSGRTVCDRRRTARDRALVPRAKARTRARAARRAASLGGVRAAMLLVLSLVAKFQPLIAKRGGTRVLLQ